MFFLLSLLLKHNHILAALNVLALGYLAESVALDLAHQVGFVQPDVLHRVHAHHGIRTLVILYRHQPAAIAQRPRKSRQHFLRVVVMMVGIERQNHIHGAIREAGIGLRALDERHVAQLLVSGALLGGVQKIVEDIFRQHAALRPHGAAQIRQHVADARADIRHRHAGLEPHRIDQFLRSLGGIAPDAAQARRNRFAALGGLIAGVGVGGHLCPQRRRAGGQQECAGPCGVPERILPLEEFRGIAMDARPDLKAAAQAVDKAQTDHQLAVANGSTDPTFGVDMGRNPPIPAYIGVSVTIPLRLFDRNQGEKERTQLDIRRNERLEDVTRAQIFSDADSALGTLNSNRMLLRSYKSRYLDQATRIRETVSFAYQHGGASLLDFLNAQNDYRSVQLNYLNLVGAYMTAASQIGRASC